MCLPTKTGSTNILKAISKLESGKNELATGDEWFRNGFRKKNLFFCLLSKRDGFDLNCFHLFGTLPLTFQDPRLNQCSFYLILVVLEMHSVGTTLLRSQQYQYFKIIPRKFLSVSLFQIGLFSRECITVSSHEIDMISQIILFVLLEMHSVGNP